MRRTTGRSQRRPTRSRRRRLPHSLPGQVTERHLVTSRRSTDSAPSAPEPEATACPGRNRLRVGRYLEQNGEKTRARSLIRIRIRSRRKAAEERPAPRSSAEHASGHGAAGSRRRDEREREKERQTRSENRRGQRPDVPAFAVGFGEAGRTARPADPDGTTAECGAEVAAISKSLLTMCHVVLYLLAQQRRCHESFQVRTRSQCR
jgi:hypothetical protein